MEDIIQDFLIEARDYIDSLDIDLLDLEKDITNIEVAQNVFRVFHTLKGTCGFLSFYRLQDISHAVESILDLIIKQEESFTIESEVFTHIFEAVDTIKEIIVYIEENLKEPEGDDKELIKKLKNYTETSKEEDVKAEDSKPEDSKADSSKAEAGKSEDSKAEDSKAKAEDSKPEDSKAKAEDNKTEDSKADSSKAAEVSKAEDNKAESSKASDIKAESKKKNAEEPNNKKNGTKEKATAEKNNTSNVFTKTIRVNVNLLEDLIYQASELILVRNQIMQLVDKFDDVDITSVFQRLNHITTEIHETAMKTRMQSVGSIWSKFPRVIRDITKDLDKEVNFITEGEDTELDKQLLDSIKDPLLHMIRNSVDHGIETRQQRLKMKKPKVGKLTLKAYHQAGHIIVEVSDDGRGISLDLLAKKAIQNKLVSEKDIKEMKEKEILDLIFHPGFSTKDVVTSVSGRGVGMDVVKDNIERVSGTLDISSKEGEGTSFKIKIPLTLAIMPVLTISISGQLFGLPQINVAEIVNLENKSLKFENINGKPVLRLRDILLPLVSLSNLLNLEGKEEKVFKKIIVCEVGEYRLGIIVDSIYDIEEIVVKPVSPVLSHLDIYAGSTILGDGSVIMILDLKGLVRASGISVCVNNTLTKDIEKRDSSFITFKLQDNSIKAIPLEFLSRLGNIDISDIEYSMGSPVIQYKGSLVHLFTVNDSCTIPDSGMQNILMFLSEDSVLIAIVVDCVLDIVKSSENINISSMRNQFIGSISIDNQIVDIIDPGYYISKFNNINNAGSKRESDEIGSVKKVLFVDDSSFFRKFIPPELEKAGYQVSVFSSAKLAIECLKEETDFVAIISDVTMPEMSAFEFLDYCRDIKNRIAYTPFIAMFSSSSSIDQKVQNFGFNACLKKTEHWKLVNVLDQVISDFKHYSI